MEKDKIGRWVELGPRSHAKELELYLVGSWETVERF